MKCPACGTESNGTAKFCEMCGAPLPIEAQPTEAVGYAAPVEAAEPYAAEQPEGQFSPYDAPQQSAAPVPPASSPYAQPGQAAQGPQASNTPFVLAIIALVTGFLGLFPVSLVLAIIALVMNSGQKKRGEVSTKQTPTFVMSLISLILSALTLVFAIVLGGLVWTMAATGALEDMVTPSSSVTVSSSSTGADESASASSAYSTSEKPSASDFQWATSDVFVGNTPSGATTLTSFSAVKGSWKAHTSGSTIERYFNVDLSGKKEAATVNAHWYQAYDKTKGTTVEDKTPGSTYNGSWTGMGLTSASTSGSLILVGCWEQNGRQYAVGVLQWPDGSTDNLALVRP